MKQNRVDGGKPRPRFIPVDGKPGKFVEEDPPMDGPVEGTVARKSNVFGPKKAGHPSVGQPCPVCRKPFAAGDYTTLVPLGPDSEEERARRDAGRPYNAVAVEVHAACGLTREQP